MQRIQTAAPCEIQSCFVILCVLSVFHLVEQTELARLDNSTVDTKPCAKVCKPAVGSEQMEASGFLSQVTLVDEKSSSPGVQV